MTVIYDEHDFPMLAQPLEGALLRVISLGAGLQSSAMALMAARREIGPMPDAAIFADTGQEPARVYAHLDWLESQLPFPIIRARRDGVDLGRFQADTAHLPLKGRHTIPLFLDEPQGMMAKQCSKEFKTRVVQRVIRGMLGLEPGQRGPRRPVVEQWIGMDRGEQRRVKPAERKWIQNRWPLIERGMRRRDVERWREERQYPRFPKSSCIFCPFRDDASWADMKENEPADFEKACAFDEAFRPGFQGMEGQAFVHYSRVPLRRADFSVGIRPQAGDLFELSGCATGCGS